jgi:thioesterase domain-containing protein
MPALPEPSQAKRMLLEKYLRGELTPTTMNTITRRISALPQSSSRAERTSLVAVQPSGSRRPFFYLHVHWQGGAFYCFTLARGLGLDQPFYVLDPYRFDDLPEPPTVEVMAADYIKLLREVQAEGPYLVGAFCGASVIAYEVAQQLRTQGHVVDVIFIDPMAGPIQSIRLTRRFVGRIGKLLRLGADKELDWFLRLRYLFRVVRRARDEYTQYSDRLMRRWRMEHPPGRFSLLPAAGALRQDWIAVFIWAVAGYVARPYPGKVTYLFAKDNHDSRKLWWGKARTTETTIIRTIPGTHETCRTEHIDGLVEHLRMFLNAAQTRVQP